MPERHEVSAKPIVVTGGAGYIGSVLTRELLSRQYRVRVLDSLLYGGQSLTDLIGNPNFELIQGDITDHAVADRAVAGAGAVIHLAALVGDPICSQHPARARAVNRDGTRVVVDAAEKAGVDRFIFASTCSNYGRMKDGAGMVDETSPLNPISLYAELKVEMEQVLLSYDGTMTPSILRFATAFGMSPRPRFDLTVNDFTATLCLDRKLEIYGEQFWRPYCHTRDLAAGCITALFAPKHAVRRRAFNVGSNRENFQKSTIAQMILDDMPEKRHLISFVSRNEDPRDYRVSFDRITSELGYTANTSVRDGIREVRLFVSTSTPSIIDSPNFRNS